MSLLLCFSGQIGSGKSSISAAVAKCLNCNLTSFGDYLRAEIHRAGGDPLNREVLQDLGQRRIREDPVVFCREVLAFGGFQPGQQFVLDGIRHVAIFDILKVEARPSKAYLLFLAANDGERFARVRVRTDSEDFDRASKHYVEAELAVALPSKADVIVNANQPFDGVVSDCLHAVKQWTNGKT